MEGVPPVKSPFFLLKHSFITFDAYPLVIVFLFFFLNFEICVRVFLFRFLYPDTTKVQITFSPSLTPKSGAKCRNWFFFIF